MTRIPRFTALLLPVVSGAFLLSACGTDILSTDGPPSDVKSERIDLSGANNKASIDTPESALRSAGTVLTVAKNLVTTLEMIALVAGDSEEADTGKSGQSKVKDTQDCSNDGSRSIDATLNVSNFKPKVAIEFVDCVESGLRINGHVEDYCDSNDCKKGDLVVGRNNEELSLSSAGSSASSFFAGVGYYNVRNSDPLNASLRSNLKAQVNLGNAQVNFVTGYEGGPLIVDLQESGAIRLLDLNGSLGVGSSSASSDCGQGRVIVTTLTPLQLTGDGQITDGSLTLDNTDGDETKLDFSSNGVTITTPDGVATSYTTQELQSSCGF